MFFMPYMLYITAVLFKPYAWEGFPYYFIFKLCHGKQQRKKHRLVWRKKPEKFSVSPMGGKPWGATVQQCYIFDY